MKVLFSKYTDAMQAIFTFTFHLENDDKEESISFNAGRKSIFLGPKTAHFFFPFDIAIPHPDLICMAALKIISPYCGSRLIMERPVSSAFAKAAKEIYPHISINSSNETQQRTVFQEKYAVSFSGGADSLATANICPPGTPLILLARKNHPDIGVFEPWYKTDGNIDVLKSMPDTYVKICVFSDFEFLSTNHNYCIYPDTYGFTIPSILLADHLCLSGILTGDILAAFTGDETRPYSLENFAKMQRYYASVGIDFDSPIKGVSEIGSEIINRYYSNSDIAQTCQYGSFKNPCMKCIKCFRKTLIKSYLDNSCMDENTLKTFSNSTPIKMFYEKQSISFQLTFHEILKRYKDTNNTFLIEIFNKIEKKDDTSYMTKLFGYPYRIMGKHNDTISHCLKKLENIFSDMTPNEEKYILY